MQPNDNGNGNGISGLLNGWDLPMLSTSQAGGEPLEDPLSLFVDIFNTKQPGIEIEMPFGSGGDATIDVHWPPW